MPKDKISQPIPEARWDGMAKYMGRALTETEIKKLETTLMMYGDLTMDKETGEIKGIMKL